MLCIIRILSPLTSVSDYSNNVALIEWAPIYTTYVVCIVTVLDLSQSIPKTEQPLLAIGRRASVEKSIVQ